ncbi:LCP family protein [Pseudonocardia sp. DSM 110487]|uniref:LCP family protein n=1 Tax=Pseudonocardia sp. DSM 110487 TaxID=2865833 RepID=UPI001C6A5090|nr:LCP family protein [Pseudonocardia sp. DSM 110487]QYN34231.1 LCP family protein [Pseudonocardia sp. DSM 110487]
MTDDRQRVPGRDRMTPPPRQAPRQQGSRQQPPHQQPPRQQPPRQPQQRQPPPRQQPPPPAARRSDRGHRAVPPSRHAQPPRPVAPSDATRAMPTTQRPPRPRDVDPATSPVPRPAPGSPRPAAPPRGPQRRSAAAARAAVTTALPTSRALDDPEPPTVRHDALPAARTSVTRPPRRRRPEPLPAEVEVEEEADEKPRRSFGKALAAAAASTVAPGSGHLMLHRTRTGAVILGTFLLVIAVLVILVLSSDTAELLETALSSNVLVMATVGSVAAAIAWVAVIVRTYLLARPPGLGAARQAIGVATVVALSLVVAAPLGFGANLANSQRTLLDDLFAGGGGTSAAEAIAKPKLNILLVGSDAGPDRKGARTDTMMVANIDTKTGRTVLFALPRNIQYAQFPPDSPMGEEFPSGFHNPDDPLSGDYLLNAVYSWGLTHPKMAPSDPTSDPGLNLLHQTVAHMLGLQLDYYLEVNMAGFESIIDAFGGVTMDVGPERIPVGGITPSGRHVRPDYYLEPGVQQLSGKQALDFARSRSSSSDYARMGRQRCLLQSILSQKSPTDMLANFQSVATATTNSVSTNIPQAVLPALAALGGNGISLESVSFDPSLPDPSTKDGNFSTADPNFRYMRRVVQDAINRPPPPPAPPTNAAAAAPTTRAGDADDDEESTGTEEREPKQNSAAPTSLAESC